MKTYSEYINELFDSSYDWELEKQGNNKNVFAFNVKGDRYIVDVESGYRMKKSTIKLDFSKNGSSEQDPSENPIKIFGTMLDILKVHYEFEDYDVLIILGKTDDKSRIKLYEKFAKTIVKKYNFSSYKTEKNEDNYTKFIISK